MSGYRPLLPDVCRVLEQHGGRLSVAELAAALGQPADEIRRQVDAYADLDSTDTLDLSVGWAYLQVDPVDTDSDAPARSDEDVVVLVAAAEDVIGVEQFDATVLGPLYQAAEELLAEEPHNETLADAVVLLRQRFLPGVRRRRLVRARWLGPLRQAIEQRRQVRIVYSRAWEPGVTTRTIHPYDLTFTGEGAEVDAGPLDDKGAIRTFLVPRIRELEVLEATFDRPIDALARCIAARELTSVTGYVTQERRWVVDKWSEHFDVGDEDDGGFTFTAHLLPPVAWRCALMRVAAGADLDLDDPALEAAGADLARRLMDHHRLHDLR